MASVDADKPVNGGGRAPDQQDTAAARPQRPRTRLPGAERRGLILEAATAEFARVGYEDASLGRIAAAAGVARTVLYDHFASKQELFVELLRIQYTALFESLRPQIVSAQPMRERIASTYDAFFKFVEERPLAWRLLFPSRPPLDPAVAADYRTVRGEANRLLAQLFEADAQRGGVDPSSDVGRLIYAMQLEALHGAARWWRAHPNTSRAEMVTAAIATLWTGMSAAERGEEWVQQRTHVRAESDLVDGAFCSDME